MLDPAHVLDLGLLAHVFDSGHVVQMTSGQPDTSLDLQGLEQDKVKVF